MMPDAFVYVVDDDQAMRESLAFLLEAAKVPVQTYESGAAFLQALPKIDLGCVVTDVRMPGMSGVELLRKVREQKATLPVIVITGHGDVPLAVEAMKMGAADFLEKPFDDDTLLASIRAALAEQADDHERQASRAAIAQRLTLLSMRERQVLEGLLRGHPNKTIAYDLAISARTVEVYRAHVMTKMEASSLSDLVRMALIGGILDQLPAAD